MSEPSLITHPLTPDRWNDFTTVLGKSGQSGCWCCYWLTETSKAFRTGSQGGAAAGNRTTFRARITAGPPPGLVAYEGNTPIAWVRVLPRAVLPGLNSSKFFATDLPTAGVWSLSCFVIRAGWRRKGLMTPLITAAAAHAKAQGATALEAYPTDTAQKQAASAVYLGVASTFRRLGFVEVQRRADHKPMMRLALE